MLRRQHERDLVGPSCPSQSGVGQRAAIVAGLECIEAGVLDRRLWPRSGVWPARECFQLRQGRLGGCGWATLKRGPGGTDCERLGERGLLEVEVWTEEEVERWGGARGLL
jgi:hypothetical protein